MTPSPEKNPRHGGAGGRSGDQEFVFFHTVQRDERNDDGNSPDVFLIRRIAAVIPVLADFHSAAPIDPWYAIIRAALMAEMASPKPTEKNQIYMRKPTEQAAM